MHSVNQSKALFRGAFILAIAAFVTKILSAVYRIPFQNIVGDVGFYIYQQVYPFYGLAMILATTGFPVVISKLCAEQKDKGNDERTRRLLFVAFVILQLFGLLCFLILYVGAEQIAIWMNDAELAILLRVVSIVFLIFPIVAILRGYYQGIGYMVPTALSQVSEQTTRVLTIIILASILTRKDYSLYLVGGGAMFGSITGSMVSVIILFTFLWIRKEWKRVTLGKGMLKNYFSEAGVIFKVLTFQGLTICVSGMLLIFMQLADSLNLYSLLVASGIDQSSAKSLKGIYDRGQPLIQLGTVVATAMSLSLVPLITSIKLKKGTEFLHDKIELALKISFVIGVGASAGLWAIIEPTNIMLFENKLGSNVLAVLCFVILFSSIITTILAIMQGLGCLLFPAIVIAVSFPVKYTLNAFLVPSVGTIGAAFSTLITLAIVCIFLYHKFKSMITIPVLPLPFLPVVLAAMVMMVAFLKVYLALTADLSLFFDSERIGAAIQALSGVFFGGIIFLFIVVKGRVFRESELAIFPFGSKLRLLLPRKDRS